MNFFKIFFATLLAIVLSVVVFIVIFVGGIVGLIAGASSSVAIKPESVLVIDMNESIVDTPLSNPLSMIDIKNLSIKNQITTLDAIRAIEQAAMDDNIKGVYIRPRMNNELSMAILEELREELKRFMEQGKFVVAYGDGYSQGEYYLASVADTLYLQPEGMIVWQGMAATSMFYRGLLDKLDVDVEVFRPAECTYKSAIEPLTRHNMSPQSREQSTALVESLWGSVSSDVAQSRHSTPFLLNKYADNLISLIPSDAVAANLVDELIYEDQLEQKFKSLGVKLNDNDKANRVSLSNYILNQELLTPTSTSAPEVAVIYAEGVIVDGEGEIGEIGGDALARTLARLRRDSNVKSVVLRVNSPGGSALASDVVWREMSLLRGEKPLIVSMGGYAASGGYYISAPADVIMANRLTITGSIGVYGVLLDFEKGLSSKLGITSDAAKSNTSADFMRVSRPINPTERAVMNRSVDQVYNTFSSHVSSGRNLSMERVHNIAQGRVWSGEDALNIGLVDGIGGIKTAILLAAERGGMSDNFQISEHTPTSQEWSAFLLPLTSAIFPQQNIFHNLNFMKSKNGVVMFSPLRVE
ncbi:MAG: signal peptide peptidase SppA [Rikenellaceae bacterium]